LSVQQQEKPPSPRTTSAQPTQQHHSQHDQTWRSTQTHNTYAVASMDKFTGSPRSVQRHFVGKHPPQKCEGDAQCGHSLSGQKQCLRLGITRRISAIHPQTRKRKTRHADAGKIPPVSRPSRNALVSWDKPLMRAVATTDGNAALVASMLLISLATPI